MNNGLKNKTIILTRSGEQAVEPRKKLESLGANVIAFPTIKIVPISVFNHFDTYAEKLKEFNYIVFTSENAVEYSIKRLRETKREIPEKLQVVCVGRKTADKCEEYGIKVDIVPDDYSAEGLLKYFFAKEIVEKKFFIPSSAIARTELKMGLLEQKADVVQIPIYDAAMPDEEEIQKGKKQLEGKKIDLIIFTSPSTFRNFLKIMQIDKPGKYFKDIKIAAIGPTTAAVIERAGLKIDISPSTFTMDDLIDTIIQFYSKD